MNIKKVMLIIALLVLVLAFFLTDSYQYFDLNFAKSQLDAFTEQVEQNPIVSAVVFCTVYVIVTALSLPGAAILTLLGGALFGLGLGLVMISFASTIGATLAFLSARFVLRDSVERRFQKAMDVINKGMAREGSLYLFSLRLIPLFPFFVINLVMGLTRIKTWRFMWVSQLGMLPGTWVYVNAGTQLSQIDSLKDLTSPELIFSLVLLAMFPFLVKRLLNMFKVRRALKGVRKPKRFDTNLIVIGAGSAGLVAAYIAAAIKAKVTLIEKHQMGGDCLNTGCVPSKALIRSAKWAYEARQAHKLGFELSDFKVNFPEIMERVQRKIAAVEPHDSVERYTKLGVDCVQGQAKVISPYEVEVNGQRISAPKIIIASGAQPFVPDWPGLKGAPYYTSNTLWQLRDLPSKLVILGGGPIGCELAQAFVRLGSQVTLVNRGSRLLPKEDKVVSEFCFERFREEGINILNSHEGKGIRFQDWQFFLACEGPEGAVELEFSHLLIALGRKANTEGLGLEALGVRLRDNGTIETDEYLQTAVPTIYATGDVTSAYQFTHAAAHQSWYATVNAILGFVKRWRVDYSALPRTTFLDPEVAQVGLNEQEAQANKVAYELSHFDVSELDRAIVDEVDYGFIRVLTAPGKDTILGVTIVAAHAGELLAEFVLAMKKGHGLNTVLGTIHSYPTMAEANKYVAGEWKRAHAPAKILAWLQKFHAWRIR